MAKVSAFEAKTRFGELLERVAAGEEVVITRHDKPVARVIPEGLPRRDQVRDAVAGLRELRRRILRRSRSRRSPLSDREARAAIERGRL
jgi:prevent-host-death family protein